MPDPFTPLAGPELLSLSCRRVDIYDDNEQVPDIPAMAELTALTRLELIDYECQLDFAPLRQLGLKELVLDNCPYIPRALFVLGALTALQKLHIVEYRASLPPLPSLEAFQRDLVTPLSEGYLEAHQLVRLGAIIFSLPSLVQLSGRWSLFALGMAEELEGWHTSPYKKASMTEYEWGGDDLLTWIKPLRP